MKRFAKRTHRFIKLDGYQKRLFFQAIWHLCKAKFVIHCLPYKWLRPYLGTPMVETLKVDIEDPRVQLVRRAIRQAAKILPFHCQCLVLAICAMKMYGYLGLPVTMYLGVAKDDENTKPLRAHAWVRCGNRVVTGEVQNNPYVVTYFYS